MKLKVAVRVPLRTRVLAGVLVVMLAALIAFDLAAASALRRYLYTQTRSWRACSACTGHSGSTCAANIGREGQWS